MPSTAPRPLLSIAIPAYDRPAELEFALYRFIRQIVGRYERDIEIIVSDDCTPNDGLARIARIADKYSFITFRSYDANVGLERNLMACAHGARGEYLWIFGDDDFLEPPDALDEIMAVLKAGEHDFVVLNRTRRSFDLTKQISANWMNLPGDGIQRFDGLRTFCRQFGFISVIGFISVNIFRRAPFQAIDAEKYFGTMYPQLGVMVEAFHDRPVALMNRPLVCHRTQTGEEKRSALGGKTSEADFMANSRRRDAIYFSHPYVAMVSELMNCGALEPDDVVAIPENTVINGLLIDFLIKTVGLGAEFDLTFDDATWRDTRAFFERLPLDTQRQARVQAALSGDGRQAAIPPTDAPRSQSHSPSHSGASSAMSPTISVITPSFNQGLYLDACLTSVRDQTYPAIEHLVFDPGSTDGSRDIARTYPHVTLIAEPDEGQSDAVNKGFSRALGDIIAWVNSDDIFADTTVFERVIARFQEPDAPDIVYGKGVYIGENDEYLRDVYINKKPESLPWRLQQEDGILQPALFMRRSVYEKVGAFRNDRHYCMDYEFWIRCIKDGVRFAYVDENFATARYHISNKTYGMRGHSYAEVCDMLLEHFGYVNHLWLSRYAEYLAEGHDGVLADAVNSGVSDKARLDAIYTDLLKSYDTGRDVYDLLEIGRAHV